MDLHCIFADLKLVNLSSDPCHRLMLEKRLGSHNFLFDISIMWHRHLVHLVDEAENSHPADSENLVYLREIIVA